MPTLSNNELKRIKSLSQKKFRDELGLFTVEGDKMVEEALRSDFEVVEVYRRDEIGETAMGRISSLSTPPPSLAVVRQPKEYRKTANANSEGIDTEFFVPASGLVVGLDSIRDPGNLGTILRTADWFGIRDVYVSRDTVELFNPKVVQATMGSIFRVRVHNCSLVNLAGRIREANGLCFGTFMDGENLFGFDFNEKMGNAGPCLIVFGNEANGISDAVAEVVDYRLNIPRFSCPLAESSDVSTRNVLSSSTHPAPESLNAATATGIVLAEYRQQTNGNNQL